MRQKMFFFFIFFLDSILDMKNENQNMREDDKSLGKLQDRLNEPCVKFGVLLPNLKDL